MSQSDLTSKNSFSPKLDTPVVNGNLVKNWPEVINDLDNNFKISFKTKYIIMYGVPKVISQYNIILIQYLFNMLGNFS